MNDLTAVNRAKALIISEKLAERFKGDPLVQELTGILKNNPAPTLFGMKVHVSSLCPEGHIGLVGADGQAVFVKLPQEKADG